MTKKAKQLEVINPQFRAWTRGTSFTLTMGKTQVATLVSLHASKERRLHNGDAGFYIGWYHPVMRLFVQALDGLRDRGLVVHIQSENISKPRREQMTGDSFIVTAAGEHVVELLKISGVYQELIAEFAEYDRARVWPRRRRA